VAEMTENDGLGGTSRKTTKLFDVTQPVKSNKAKARGRSLFIEHTSLFWLYEKDYIVFRTEGGHPLKKPEYTRP
jgi:hypothetical protein